MNRPDQYRQRDPLAIEALLTEDQRRTTTIDNVIAFRSAIESPNRIYDSIDEDCDFDEEIQVDPYVTGTNNRRTDTELARILELIDNLPISDNGKEGQA